MSEPAAQEPAPPDVATVITPMVRVELGELPRPVRSFLGVTVKQRVPQLADGWSWVAWRSQGRAWRTKLGDRPAGFLAQEVYSLRLAGPWASDGSGERWRVVGLWSRPLVHLAKGKLSARTGRRPVATAPWGSEAWIWRAGRAGVAPMPYPIGEAQHCAATGRPSPTAWAAMAGPWAEASARALLIDALGATWTGEDDEAHED